MKQITARKTRKLEAAIQHAGVQMCFDILTHTLGGPRKMFDFLFIQIKRSIPDHAQYEDGINTARCAAFSSL